MSIGQDALKKALATRFFGPVPLREAEDLAADDIAVEAIMSAVEAFARGDTETTELVGQIQIILENAVERRNDKTEDAMVARLEAV